VDDPQGFAPDNVRYILVDREPRRPVLIVTSDVQSPQPGFYLVRALEAAAADGLGLEPRLVSGVAVAAMRSNELSRAAVIVLTTTRGLDRRFRETLRGFLHSGGGLLIVAGPDIDASLLAGILDWREAPPHVAPQESALALSITDSRHPIFRPFGGLAANLGQVRFDRVWRVSAAGWNVAAAFTDGTPALLERPEGGGRVVVFASDLGRRWNDFPLHPAFVPFAIESVRYAAGRPESASEYFVGWEPAGAEPRPGIYHIPPDGHAAVVNVDPREGSTARVTRQEFAAMLQPVQVPASSLHIRAQQAEARQNYWRYGLLLMLAALVCESFVGRP
jgi:hypothetical protein